MKNCFCLLTFIIAVISCSKEAIEKPNPIKSVTYLRQHYDTNNRLVKIDTSIHWCRVTGADLERFENMSKEPYYVCGSFPEIWGRLTISTACPDTLKINKKI